MVFKKNKKLIRFVLIFIIIFLIIILFLNLRTGFFSSYVDIDERDSLYWNYTGDGIIANTQAFSLNGSKEVCWLLVHSYTSTPFEMREISDLIFENFNESVYVPRLLGHGELPSKILNLTLDDWYFQINSQYQKLKLECNKINVLGSSYGGAISLRLAQENGGDGYFNHLYVINGFLGVNYEWYHIINPDNYLNWFGGIFKYNRKQSLAQINSIEALKNHIAYWNMPLITSKKSMPFIEKTRNNLDKIEVPIAIFHSHNDKTAWPFWADEMYLKSNSEYKEIFYFDKSNHLLLLDYDKVDVMNKIIQTENEFREK